MNLEGGYGLFIYTLIPIAFITVLGAKALSNPDLVDPNTIFVTFAGQIFNTGGEALNWIIAIMLIVALMLSALNAIMGCARSLHQMSVDGQFPRFFQQINQHGVPARAMVFNVVCLAARRPAGGAVEIYTFSNVGYTGSFLTRARRLLPAAQVPAERDAAVQAAGVLQVRRARDGGLYAVIWLYGGIGYARHRQHRDLLLPRLGRRARLHPALPVPDAGRGQAGGAAEARDAETVMPPGAVPSK